QPPRPFQQFGVGTGEGESGLQAGSFWDVVAGHSFWTSVALRYERHIQDTRSLRVGAGTPGDPFDATARPVHTTRRLGDAYSIEVTPRFALGEYFSVGARYQYEHENAGTFSGTLDVVDSAGNVTHLDAATLGPASAFTNQWVGVGLVYSSVAASERGHGDYPFELTLQYRRQVALTNGQPVRGEWAAGLRFYQKLWGRGMGEQLARVGKRGIARFVAAQHARDLLRALVLVHHARVGRGNAAARAFANHHVVVRARGDLGEVRDRQHLMVRRDASHGVTYLQSDSPADTRVDLVEDERRDVIDARQDGLEREHDAREL